MLFPYPYEGPRAASAIEYYALEQLETNVSPPEVTELTGQVVMEDKCGLAAICFVAFQPDILDSKAGGRNTRNAPSIVKREPWDGKDAVIVEEDEFSLEELMGDESTSKDEL
ncbi:hypothetical protein AAC387_Pa10g1208 [Persea americana]